MNKGDAYIALANSFFGISSLRPDVNDAPETRSLSGISELRPQPQTSEPPVGGTTTTQPQSER